MPCFSFCYPQLFPEHWNYIVCSCCLEVNILAGLLDSSVIISEVLVVLFQFRCKWPCNIALLCMLSSVELAIEQMFWLPGWEYTGWLISPVYKTESPNETRYPDLPQKVSSGPEMAKSGLNTVSETTLEGCKSSFFRNWFPCWKETYLYPFRSFCEKEEFVVPLRCSETTLYSNGSWL